MSLPPTKAGWYLAKWNPSWEGCPFPYGVWHCVWVGQVEVFKGFGVWLESKYAWADLSTIVEWGPCVSDLAAQVEDLKERLRLQFVAGQGPSCTCPKGTQGHFSSCPRKNEVVCGSCEGSGFLFLGGTTQCPEASCCACGGQGVYVPAAVPTRNLPSKRRPLKKPNGITIRYRRIVQGVLSYPDLLWSRSEAWEDAMKYGGYRRAYGVDEWGFRTWGYTIEPELAAERDRKYGRKKPTV